MGQLEPRDLQLQVVVEQEIEVDRARAVPQGAHPAQLLLDLEQPAQDGLRGELRVDRRSAVQEARLVLDADRVRPAQRRDGGDTDRGSRPQEVERLADRRLRIAQVRAEPDVGAAHRRRSTVAAVQATGGSSCTSGLRTRTLAAATGERARMASATAGASASIRSKWRPSETSRTHAATAT